jgi:hypothetical protein
LDGQLYDSKAIAGAAVGYQFPADGPLSAADFSGGEATVAAALRSLGFDVVGPQGIERFEPEIETERSLRIEIWEQLRAEGAEDVAPAKLRELGVFGGAQGIWVDKARTGELTPDGAGVAVAVLHTGESYEDDLTPNSLLYYYPQTRRPASRDAGEVAALKWAATYEIPVFAILPSEGTSSGRRVRLSWVEDDDDQGQVFLLSFGDAPTGPPDIEGDDAPFFLTASTQEKRALRKVRQGQAEFHIKVLHRYGAACAVCDLAVPELIDAAHLCAAGQAGSFDARNGLPLCALHHRAFDRGLWGIDPPTTKLEARDRGPSLAELRISRSSLDHLVALPHPEALEHAWRAFSPSQ